MSSVLISIIVPAYNIESHIGRCLDSILAQTHKRIEIIIVDDGSTDGTGIIIDQYASIDQRIIPIHKENGGVTSARIDGIKKERLGRSFFIPNRLDNPYNNISYRVPQFPARLCRGFLLQPRWREYPW